MLRVSDIHCDVISFRIPAGQYFTIQFSSVQSLSCVRLFATPWIAAHQAFLSITNSRSLLTIKRYWVMPLISIRIPFDKDFFLIVKGCGILSKVFLHL